MESVSRQDRDGGSDLGSQSEGDGVAGTAGIAGAITVDASKVRGHLDEVVRSTVEATLNQLLEEEADRVAGGGPIPAFAGAAGHAVGPHKRKLQMR